MSLLLILASCGNRTCDPPAGNKFTIVTPLTSMSNMDCSAADINKVVSDFMQSGNNVFSQNSVNGRWYVEIETRGVCPSDNTKTWGKTFKLDDMQVKVINGSIAFELQNCPIQAFSGTITIKGPCEAGGTSCGCSRFRPIFTTGTIDFKPTSANEIHTHNVPELTLPPKCCR